MARRTKSITGAASAAPDASALDALVTEIPAIIYRHLDDDEATTVFVSPQIEAALGYPTEEWYEQADLWNELLHTDDREVVLATWDRCRAERLVFDARYRLIGADGRRVWFHDRARPTTLDDGTVVWHGVMLDITAERGREERLEEERFVLEGTVQLQGERISEADALIDLEIAERHAVEDDLRRAEARLEALKHATRDSWMYTWDVVGGRATGRFDTDSAIADFGADPVAAEVQSGDYWRRWLHPADAERVTARIRVSTTAGVPFEDSYRWVTPFGRVRWILDRAIPTAWDPATQRGTFVGIMVDVTDLMEGAVNPEG